MDPVVTWSCDLVSTQMSHGPGNIGDTIADLVYQHGTMATGDFSGARTDLYQDMSDFITDPEVNYLKRMEILDEDQLQMDNCMRRKAHEEQATRTLFEDRQERYKCTTKKKGVSTVRKGTWASNNNKKDS